MAINGFSSPMTPEEQARRAAAMVAPLGSTNTNMFSLSQAPTPGAVQAFTPPKVPTGAQAATQMGLVSAPVAPQTMSATAMAPAAAGQPAANGFTPASRDTVTQAQYREVDPVYRTVQDNETVRGQLGEIMADDSPLLQRARSRAAAAAQGRGLLNSTMGTTAGEAAMWDVATPIAQSDAQIRSAAAAQNQDTANLMQRFNAEQFGQNQQFNAGAFNALNLANIQEAGAYGRLGIQEAGQDRRLGVSEAGMNQRQAVSEGGLDRRLNISEAGQTLRSREGNETTLKATQMNNDTSRYGVDVGAKTAIQTTQMNNDTQRYGVDKNNETQRYGIDVGRDVAYRGQDVQRYGIDVGASTQRYGIDVGASTQRYGIDVGAATAREGFDVQRYTANLSADTQRSVAQMNVDAGNSRVGAEMLNASMNRIASYNNNPDMSPEYRNQAAQGEVDAFRRSQALLGNASNLNLAI